MWVQGSFFGSLPCAGYMVFCGGRKTLSNRVHEGWVQVNAIDFVYECVKRHFLLHGKCHCGI